MFYGILSILISAKNIIFLYFSKNIYLGIPKICLKMSTHCDKGLLDSFIVT